jgi:hypothetical protein
MPCIDLLSQASLLVYPLKDIKVTPESGVNLLNQEHTHYLLFPTFLISPNLPIF